MAASAQNNEQLGTQADSRRAVLRWQRAAQYAETLRTAASRAVETAPSSGPSRYINFDLIHFLSWVVLGKICRQGAAAEAAARTAARMTARPSCTARGPTGNGVPAAEWRWGSFKLVMEQTWRGIRG